MISTDLSSRWLDVEGITHIYNYDFPERAEDYIHRIGRTGRIGKEGISYSFITDKNQTIYDEVCRYLDKSIFLVFYNVWGIFLCESIRKLCKKISLLWKNEIP